MSVVVRDCPADEVLALVYETERRLPGMHGDGTERVFRKLRRWLIQEAYLDLIIFRPRMWRADWRLPGLWLQPFLRGLCALLWCRWRSPRIRGRASAQAVCVASNARAFYVDGGYTIKVYLEGRRRRVEHLVNEIETRLKLETWRSLHLPTIRHYDVESHPPFIAEDLIWGRRCRRSDARQIYAELLPQLARTYGKHGIVYRPVDQVIEQDRLISHLTQALERVRWNSRWCSRSSFLQAAVQLAARRETIPCSLGHGDLGLKNLLLSSSGAIYLVDWELAGECPIIFDLHKLVRGLPNGWAAANQFLAGLCPPPAAGPFMSCDRQRLLSAIATIDRLVARQSTAAESRLVDWISEANDALHALVDRDLSGD
jgi:hypothetical protein